MELSEPIQAAVATLHSLEAKAAKAWEKGSNEANAKGGRGDRLLAFLQLSRWMQLYITGDAENIEPELAEELAGIYKAALRKGKTSSPCMKAIIALRFKIKLC